MIPQHLANPIQAGIQVDSNRGFTVLEMGVRGSFLAGIPSADSPAPPSKTLEKGRRVHAVGSWLTIVEDIQSWQRQRRNP
jgi:hypothetical protein